MNGRSYHDVVVASKNCLYEIHNLPFNVSLRCTRTSGWALWCKEGDDDRLVASEYGGSTFAIYVKVPNLPPVAVCDCRYDCNVAYPWDLAIEHPTTIPVGKFELDANVIEAGMLNVTGESGRLDELESYIKFVGMHVLYDGLYWRVGLLNRTSQNSLLLHIDHPCVDHAA